MKPWGAANVKLSREYWKKIQAGEINVADKKCKKAKWPEPPEIKQEEKPKEEKKKIKRMSRAKVRV